MKTITVIRWKHDEAEYTTSLKKAIEHVLNLGYIVKKDKGNASYSVFEAGAEIEKNYYINPITKAKDWVWICPLGDHEAAEIYKREVI